MIDAAKMQSYTDTLNGLQAQVANAEKEAIVAETNYKNLTEKQGNLVSELEAFIGANISQAPGMLAKKEEELEKLMQALAPISLAGPITEDVVNSLKSVAEEFNIPFTLTEEKEG